MEALIFLNILIRSKSLEIASNFVEDIESGLFFPNKSLFFGTPRLFEAGTRLIGTFRSAKGRAVHVHEAPRYLCGRFFFLGDTSWSHISTAGKGWR